MPKRTDIKSIMIIGAGPIVIGQACEFDYSGTQACKALREEGYRVILVNSNPATIMTDPAMADATYIEPIHWKQIEKIIIKERPDALLATMGGQTALNCALMLGQRGILAKYQIELIGANEVAIDKAEDRDKFKQAMEKIGLCCPKSAVAHNMDEALTIQQQVGFPTIIRPSFTLGGSGGGIAYNHQEFLSFCEQGFDISPTHQLLIEQSMLGWKEFEMEVIRDKKDNCMVICSIENVDPMGVHTGDSITVAPAQTLTDKEYQKMRQAAFAVLREIGVETGGANVQFALNPDNGDMVVIEMNPRVSRSSALASKATGFPIAKVAAKLAVGFTLDELTNEITANQVPISFEPSIDYVVTKIPRFAFEKFPQTNQRLTTQMKSVGEAMAIGRTFQESLQKALRSLETGKYGLEEISNDRITIAEELRFPGPERIWYVADAFRIGMDCDEIFTLSRIDPWFLAQIEDLVRTEQIVKTLDLYALDSSTLHYFKQKGFSDSRLSQLMNVTQDELRHRRYKLGVRPVYKRVDTCAAEFDTNTAYLYSSYETACEALPTDKNKVLILGGGPNRIGQGIEFDYCCVHAALALREDGYETIMVNCNPETISTDYDISDRLYFEPLTLEDLLEIIAIEKPVGVIIQYGGQTPLKLAKQLQAAGVPILGTSPEDIDCAEDRARFQQMIQKLGLTQPNNRCAATLQEALLLADQIGYPLVVRPSYVLGGRAMEIVDNCVTLRHYLDEIVKVVDAYPILLDHFLNQAVEVDVDAISDGEQVLIGGLLEHIEEAGVHSGDSACSLPPYSLSKAIQDALRAQTIAMAKALNIVGLMNVQFAIQDGTIYVLEVNPRASRTVPFVSKATGIPLAKVAARCMMGQSLATQGVVKEVIPPYCSIKEAVFPFIKFPGVDPVLGPEMKSTGEVMSIGENFAEAFIKAQMATGERLPRQGTIFISVRNEDKSAVIEIACILSQLNFALVATKGTAEVIQKSGIKVRSVNKLMDGQPHIVDMINNNEIVLILNIVGTSQANMQDSYVIRNAALKNKVPIFTTVASAKAACTGMRDFEGMSVYDLQSWHKSIAY